MRYTRADIRKRFDAATCEAGQRAFEEGCVGHIETADQGQIISGQVRGSRHRPYLTQIQLRDDERRFSTRCDCPTRVNCKHAVALLLSALEHSPDTGLSDTVSAWVDDLFTLHQQQLDDGRGPAPRLRFECSLPDHPEPHVAVQLRRVGGSVGQAKSVSFNARWQRGGVRHPDDRALFNRLRAFADESPYVARLSEAGSGELFADLIRSGHCYWEQQRRPLKLDTPRHAEAHWQVHEDGSQSLHLEIDRGVLVLPLEPAHYIDPRRQRVGLVQTDLSPAILPLLSRAPRIASGQIEEFIQLLDRRGITGVPRPRPPQTKALASAPPQARLELMHIDDLVEKREGFVPDIYVARLQVCYGPFCFVPGQGDEQCLRKQRDKLMRIQRDLKAERALIRELMEFHDVARPGGGHFEDLVLTPYDGPAVWADFMDRRLPALREQGWQIDLRDSFDLRLVEPDHWQIDTSASGEDWFELSAGIEVEGHRYNLLDLLVQWLHDDETRRDKLPADDRAIVLDLGEGRILRLPARRVQQILRTLTELYRDRPLNRAGRLKLHRLDLARLEGWRQDWSWSGPEELRELAQRLSQPPQPARLSADFHGQLRPYQTQGLAWLQHLSRQGFSGILADDMGLGKTVQTLAHLAALHETAGEPSLIVAPTSVIGNWRAEARKFTPDLRTLLWHGKERETASLQDAQLVITSYATLLRDAALFQSRRWRLLVLDEAQTIKNPRAKISTLVRQLAARHKLCLSGTPMENHLGELWSLFDFLAPGFLGDARSFRQLFRTPIEKSGDEVRAQLLSRRIAPFLLRRRKDEVARDLPAKSEIVRSVTLGDEQAELYELLRVSMAQRIQTAIQDQGLARSQLLILDALLKLRQVCCDPRLAQLPEYLSVPGSAKLEALMDMLSELVEDGRRILVFSQFTSMLSLIEAELRARDMRYLKLTGSTTNRQALVDQFQSGTVPLFLISLKAGGTGLNLTAADTVIHYDPWWNPAVQNQATDRAHRIGQDKPVFVYKLLCENTVEERILQMQQRKQALADQLFEAGPGQFDEDDLDWLLHPLEEALA